MSDVDVEMLLECIDVANHPNLRWVIVQSDRVKGLLAEASSNSDLAAAETVVISVALGAGDSAVEGFVAALEERDGACSSVAVSADTAEAVAKVLSVPDGANLVSMILVEASGASSQGSGDQARKVAFFEKYGMTWQVGPSDPPAHADGPGAVVEVDIAAPPTSVWPHMSDINFGAKFSDEFQGAVWAEGFDGPALGAQFIGTNKNDFMGEWNVTCFISEFGLNQEFGWVTDNPDHPAARWKLTATEIEDGTRLRYSAIIGPAGSGMTAAIDSSPENAGRIIAGRLKGLSGNMAKVIAGIKEAAESDVS